MGKRSSIYERRERDFYPTPPEAVVPLAGYLQSNSHYIEPCAGDGALIRALNHYGHHCVAQYDLPVDVRTTQYDTQGVHCFITNPPWNRQILHPTIDNLRRQLPTWLLFDADWAHTVQAKEYIKYCMMIISVGRVKWIAESKHTGKDNAAWYLFVNNPTVTTFIGR